MMTPTIKSDNGTIWKLSDAISCVVTRSLDTGVYELEMTYPANGVNVDTLETGLEISARPAPGANPQPFCIYSVTKMLTGEIEVLARHVCFQLTGIPVKPFTQTTAVGTLAAIKTNEALQNASDFEYNGYVTASGSISVELPKSAWDCLFDEENSLIACFGGEVDFDGYNVMHVDRIGRDRGVTIRYGKNLTELSEDTEGGGVNGIFPYWFKKDVGLVYPDEAEFPLYPNGPLNAEIRDYTSEFENIPTASDLSALAETEVDALTDITTSITFSFVDLSHQKEYETIAALERVFIGDTVRIVCLKPSVRKEARIIETVFDVLADRYESVTAGSTQSDLAGTIAGNMVSQSEALATALKGIIATKSIDLMTNFTATAGQAKGQNPATNVDIYAGYYPLEVIRMRSSNNSVGFYEARLNRGTTTTVVFGARNNGSATISNVTIRAIILYIKNEYQVTL